MNTRDTDRGRARVEQATRRHTSPTKPQRRGEHDCQQDHGEREHEVGRAHRQLLDPAAQRGGHQAQQHAEHQPEQHRDDTDDQRVLRPRHQERQHVAAELVGAQQELRRWRLQARAHVHPRD